MLDCFDEFDLIFDAYDDLRPIRYRRWPIQIPNHIEDGFAGGSPLAFEAPGGRAAPYHDLLRQAAVKELSRPLFESSEFMWLSNSDVLHCSLAAWTVLAMTESRQSNRPRHR